MKYFIAITLIAAVASASLLQPVVVSEESVNVQEIVAAIQSPSTDPATAALLEQLLLESLGIQPSPIAVGPAIVPISPVVVVDEVAPSPVTVVDQAPIAPSPVIVVDHAPATPVAPTPVVEPTPVGIPAPEIDVTGSSSPLVQIILNINQAAANAESPVAPAPVVEAAPVIDAAPVTVVDQAVSPVVVVDQAPTPVIVVDQAPTPVNVVDQAPTPVAVVEQAPIIVAEPIVVPSPAITLPETLN